MTVKLFITGVTGYVGGDFLYNVTEKHPDWQTSILVRTEDKASKVKAQFPGSRIVLGDNSSSKLVEDEAANADIVFHFADSADDAPSATAIAAGLKRTGGHWIHTSGTMILTRPDLSFDSYGHDDGESYTDDDSGISRLTSLPDAAPHRDIDKIVLAAGDDKVKTAVVCPPTIYGPGRGPDNRKSMQAYKSAEVMLRNKKGFIYAKGENIWHQVHVQDLTDLYILLGEAAVKGDSRATWNEKGYYLAENGAFAWGDILRAITKYACQKGYLPSEEMDIVDAAKAQGRYPMSVGTTAKGFSHRAKELLGWKPYRRSLLEEVPDIVDGEARNMNLS